MYRVSVFIIIFSILIATIASPYVSASTGELDEVPPNSIPLESDTKTVVVYSKIEQNVQSTRLISEGKTTTENETTDVDSKTTNSENQASTISLISNNVTTGPETTPSIIVSSFVVSSTIEYVELYNQSDMPYNLETVSLRASSNSSTCTLYMNTNGWLLPKTFALVSSPTAQTKASLIFKSDCLFGHNINRLELFSEESRLQLIDGINERNVSAWFRHKSTVKSNCAETSIPSTLKQSGSASTDFVACSNGPSSRSSPIYKPPTQSDIKIIEVMSNSRSCSPDDAGDDCFDYVKVKNTSTQAINLAELRLRTGSSNASATTSTSFHWMQPTLHPLRDEYMLEPGAILTVRQRDDSVPLSITNDEGNVWIEDYFGVKSYQSVQYQGMGLSAARGKSWAFDSRDNTWKYGTPAPYGENEIPNPVILDTTQPASTPLKPCRDDQYRSEETNRCRNIVQASTQAPCKEGQYRNEETNRCRSIALAAASTLKPCADDYYRNPDTNRCRKIAGSEDLALADCGEGRERNPETNRCRNILRSAPAPADFSVEPIKEPASVFIGWWVMGGVALLVVGYAGWEWREEIAQRIRKVAQFIKSGR